MLAPTEQHDPETGEVLDFDAPDNGGWDKEHHCITDLRGANWAGQRLREAEEQIRLTWEMHEAEIASLRAKIKAAEDRAYLAAAPFKATVAYMTSALTAFASTPEGKAEVLKGLRKKSRLLPCGVTIGWRTQKAGYRWDQSKTPAENKAALVAWARAEEAARAERFDVPLVVPGPDLADLDAIKSYLTEVGGPLAPPPVPPGLEYVPPGETLTVSVGEEESK
jgi:hypothetical protein